MESRALKTNSMDDFDLRMSEESRPFFEAVVEFLETVVDPMQAEFFEAGEGRADRWSYTERQLELFEGAKDKAKAQGLWNFFLPDSGQGLSNLDYAYLAVELGKYPLGPESLNCSAPDTGNMEVLERVGTPEQKQQWLEPLLNGEIRSCFGMTEPGVASSDAKNVRCQAVRDGDEYLINGEKYYISGAGDPRCKIMILMCQTSPDGPPHRRQSQILVPMDAQASKFLAPCMSLAKTMRHMATCICASPMCGCLPATCYGAKAGVSKSHNSASVLAASTTACEASGRRRRRLI